VFRFYYSAFDSPPSAATSTTTPLPPSIQELSTCTDYDIITDVTPQEECSICKLTYKEMDVLRKLHACQHSFHVDCVDKWFEKSRYCPLCRCDITQPPLASVQATTTQTTSMEEKEEEDPSLDMIDNLLDTILLPDY